MHASLALYAAPSKYGYPVLLAIVLPAPCPQTLGLDKYANNLKKGKLTDSTIMLWNDSALAEAKIPAGPRLLILHHLDAYRSPSSVLKPALAVPMYPVQPPPRPAPGAPAAAPGALAAAPKPAPAKQ